MAQGNGTRNTGVCKRWDDQRGFGFLTPDEPGKDVFVHFSQIQANGFKKLSPGQRVEYDVVKTAKGLEAQHVVVVGS
jgi:CspA family cold shock protein